MLGATTKAVRESGGSVRISARWGHSGSNATTTCSGSRWRGPASQRVRPGADRRAHRSVRRRRRGARRRAGGRGQILCAGADIAWMRAAADLASEESVADADRLGLMLEAIDAARLRSSAASRASRSAAALASSRAGTCDRHRGVRVLGGEARDRPGGDLAVRAREDRTVRGPALLRDGRALRRDDRAPDRVLAGGHRDLDAAVDRVVGELLTAGPGAARGAKARLAGPTDGDGAPDRRAPRERRGPGGPARLPRTPQPHWARLVHRSIGLTSSSPVPDPELGAAPARTVRVRNPFAVVIPGRPRPPAAVSELLEDEALGPLPGRTWPHSIVRTRSREACASGSCAAG